MKRGRKKFFTWIKLGFVLYIIVVSFFLYFNKYGYKTYLSLKRDQKKLSKIKRELIQKEETLKRELELQNASSPFFIEMVARERLRMAKEGEIIYFISNNGKKK